MRYIVPFPIAIRSFAATDRHSERGVLSRQPPGSFLSWRSTGSDFRSLRFWSQVYPYGPPGTGRFCPITDSPRPPESNYTPAVSTLLQPSATPDGRGTPLD